MARSPLNEPPEWWGWDLAFTAHVESRMEERTFSEVELRLMLTDATELLEARRPDRYLASTRLGDRRWIVVLEPDFEAELLFVVTAYPVDGS
jgi:hypothetical protein